MTTSIKTSEKAVVKFSKYMDYGTWTWCVDNYHELPDYVKYLMGSNKEFSSKKELMDFFKASKASKVGTEFAIGVNGGDYDIVVWEAVIGLDYSKEVWTEVHIHSCLATYASSDKTVYKKGLHSPYCERKKGVDVETDDFVIVKYENKTAYYADTRRSGKSREEVKEIFEKEVNSFLEKGYSLDNLDFYEEWKTQKIESDKLKRIEYKIENGYVLWKEYEDRELKDYHGGLSLELFMTEKLISYAECGNPGGYLGCERRKAKADQIVEKHLREVLTLEEIACWMTSTDARHFGDYFEHFMDDNDWEGFEVEMKKSIATIHNIAKIFNSPDHKGNLKSTNELRAKFEELGMMLEEDKSCYRYYNPFKDMK
jgi:hypothetical protein